MSKLDIDIEFLSRLSDVERVRAKLDCQEIIIELDYRLQCETIDSMEHINRVYQANIDLHRNLDDLNRKLMKQINELREDEYKRTKYD